ncbi:GyrI-like domain-containing protein [uncultured Bacteroides sp.]|uniref:GyrI-like domain-containing protein n=1 Tax=uncultured Bacteroides sp. TaxID=162156 RepID=UPI0025D8BF9A|nr:GyrI-like domain-containing protein [uncultured Bacteroides sp.]
MAEKYEWKKAEKSIYTLGKQPLLVDIPTFKFFTLAGVGDPNDAFFAEHIQCLFSLSYALKMQWKKETGFDYAVYPLEGVWALPASECPDNEGLNKKSLIYTLMVRQPDFVSEEYATDIIEKVKIKKPHPLLANAKFEAISEGLCVQMLHQGSYDNEATSFAEMDAFARNNNLFRTTKVHREIYLSDARKVQADKLKTILRFQVNSL